MAVKRKSDGGSVEEGRQNKRTATKVERDAEEPQARGSGNDAANEERDEVKDAYVNSSTGCSLVHARTTARDVC